MREPAEQLALTHEARFQVRDGVPNWRDSLLGTHNFDGDETIPQAHLLPKVHCAHTTGAQQTHEAATAENTPLKMRWMLLLTGSLVRRVRPVARIGDGYRVGCVVGAVTVHIIPS